MIFYNCDIYLNFLIFIVIYYCLLKEIMKLYIISIVFLSNIY